MTKKTINIKLSTKEFSRLSNVSQEALRQAVKKNQLKRDNQFRYDLSDKINIAYLISKGITPKKINEFVKGLSGYSLELLEENAKKYKDSLNKNDKKNSKNKKISIESEIEEKLIDEQKFKDITGLPSEFMRKTIEELIFEYDEPATLKLWVEIYYKILQSQERAQKIKERDLELIEKDFVMKYISKYLELLNRTLLDYPESAIDNLIALAKTENKNIRVTLIEDMTKDVSRMLEETRELIKRELKELIYKYESKNESEEVNNE